MSEKTKIIIADDNTAWCDLLKKFLEKNSDVEIIGITSDGEEQIAMIKTLKPNIVVTDLKRKKGLSGIEVIKRCNKENIGNVKFLVETGCYYEEQMDMLKDIGIKHILRKPFVLDNIIEKIEEIQNEEIKDLITIKNEIQENKRSILDFIKAKILELKISTRKG